MKDGHFSKILKWESMRPGPLFISYQLGELKEKKWDVRKTNT